MMEVLTTLGRTLGFSFSAGINLYATVAILGLASRYGWVDLPPQFKVFDHDFVIAAALIMYAIEFVADKVPWVDSLWDTVHTAIRPIGGALIAVSTFGETSPAVTGLIALLGGTVAASTHATKAGTRAVANTSPEPISNWILSFHRGSLRRGPRFRGAEIPDRGAGRHRNPADADRDLRGDDLEAVQEAVQTAEPGTCLTHHGSRSTTDFFSFTTTDSTDSSGFTTTDSTDSWAG